jgi:predicted  nucleic acid-binding Zn-ribbon protein
MAEMKDIKTKFNTLQTNVTKLNNTKIGLESEIKTISSDQVELVEKLLQLTGKTTLEDAFKYYTDKNIELEEKKTKLSTELEDYLSLEQDSDINLT